MHMPTIGKTQKPAGKVNSLKSQFTPKAPLPGLQQPVYKGNVVLIANK